MPDAGGVEHRYEERLGVAYQHDFIISLQSLSYAANLLTTRLAQERGFDEALLERAKRQWYGLMGWTAEGVPTDERLAALGISELL